MLVTLFDTVMWDKKISHFIISARHSRWERH